MSSVIRTPAASGLFPAQSSTNSRAGSGSTRAQGTHKTGFITRLVILTPNDQRRPIDLLTPRLTIGRRAYNQLVLDDLSVSGEHAVIQSAGADYTVVDLHSRNGTLVDGSPVQRHLLTHGQELTLGVYTLQFEQIDPRAPLPQERPLRARLVILQSRRDVQPRVHVASGARQMAQGAPIPLQQAITSVEITPTDIAIFSRRSGGIFVTHLEGLERTRVNGEAIGFEAMPLDHGDLIEIAGTLLQLELAQVKHADEVVSAPAARTPYRAI